MAFEEQSSIEQREVTEYLGLAKPLSCFTGQVSLTLR
uniref:Uncharacterized protein n=1 Tax=Arundo donax TaxID=35708 RepID=A0A0A9E6G4_ARUDO